MYEEYRGEGVYYDRNSLCLRSKQSFNCTNAYIDERNTKSVECAQVRRRTPDVICTQDSYKKDSRAPKRKSEGQNDSCMF